MIPAAERAVDTHPAMTVLDAGPTFPRVVSRSGEPAWEGPRFVERVRRRRIQCTTSKAGESGIALRRQPDCWWDPESVLDPSRGQKTRA